MANKMCSMWKCIWGFSGLLFNGKKRAQKHTILKWDALIFNILSNSSRVNNSSFECV